MTPPPKQPVRLFIVPENLFGRLMRSTTNNPNAGLAEDLAECRGAIAELMKHAATLEALAAFERGFADRIARRVLIAGDQAVAAARQSGVEAERDRIVQLLRDDLGFPDYSEPETKPHEEDNDR